MSSSDSIITEEIKGDLLDDNVMTLIITDGGQIKYKEELRIELDNPYIFDPSHFLPNTTPMNLPRFFKIASQLISDAQSRAGIVDDEIVELVEEYPPDNFARLGDEAIAFRVLKREPARMNAKGTARPHRKSTYYYETMSPEYPNKTIVVESRPVDHIIEFTCWAKTNKLANNRALWLEKLFVNHAWAFETQGVERFFWRDRGPDTFTTTGGQRLFYRPINFFVRFREFEIKSNPLVKQIIVSFSASESPISSEISETSNYE